MGQCMSLAISLRKCLESLLARGEVGAREEDRIDCEKGTKGARREIETGGPGKGFFCTVAVHRREDSLVGGEDCLFR